MTSIPLAVSFDCTPPENASKIQKSLTKFLNGASGKLGGAFDMISGLDSAVSEISDSMSSLTTSLSSLLEDKLSDFVSTGLMAAKNYIFNTITNPLAAIAQNNAFLTSAFKPIGSLFGAFGCLGSAIKKALKNTIKNLLTNMISKGIINPLECAVEDFIGTLTNKISSLMDGIIGPLVEPINKLFSFIGNKFGSIKNVLGKGLNIVNKLNGLLNCKDSGAKCHEVESWTLNKGSSKPDSTKKKQNFITKSIDAGTKKIDNIIDKLDDKIGNIDVPRIDPITGEEMEVTCNGGNILDCGLPRVEFFGGGGEGAAGNVILGNFIEELDKSISETEVIVDGETQPVGSILEDVKTTGGILGVDITYPGEGYTSEPLVSFVDNCDQGYGAYGRAVIDKDPNSPTFGQLTGVLMLSEGENYPTGEQTDVFVDKIVVEKGGTGYKINDEIEDFEICGIDENGSITKVCTNDKAYRTLPSLTVKSNTGSGAILTPIMTSIRRQSEIIQVIDCITPRDNIVGYVNGKEYNGPFHVMPNGQKMTGAVHTESDDIIYNTPQESLRDKSSRGASSTRVNLRSIQQLVQESEQTQTTESADTYSDPMDDAMDSDTDTTPPSTPPSSPPPSTPPSSGGGGYGY